MSVSKKLVVSAAALVALVAGSLAFAAVPDVGGVIHTCYKPGKWYVVDVQAGQHCAGTEKQLDINQKGPQGDPGPAGPQGAPGMSGLVRLANVSTYDAGSPKTVKVDCPAGKTAISGSASISAPIVQGQPTVVLTDLARLTNGEEGWLARAGEITPVSSNWQLLVEVTCVDLA
jgi:hypothetical protein